MDGLLTQALVDCLRVRFGDAIHDTALRAAHLDGVAIASGRPYADDVTIALADAGAAAAGISRAEMLELLGEHFVPFAIREGYGGFLTTAGRTFRDVLLNLNRMHDKIAATHPHLRQPTFWCSEVEPDSLVLHYTSTRTGLAPLVVGIVRGLARLHAARVAVEHRRRRDDGAPHDAFLIRFLP